MNPTPDTSARPSRLRPALGLALVAALAGAAAWYFTREPAPAAAGAGHRHGAMAGGDAMGMPVTLGADEQQRIGITYAAVERAPLEREVRAVALVAYDETRVRTFAPLVDGWIERLDADYTGQPVRAGQPLFTLYAPMVVAAQEELLLATRLAGEVAGGATEAARNAESLVEAARRRLRYWGVSDAEIAAIERAGTPRRTVTLHAPFGGIVVEKQVEQGQRVMAGVPASRIADLSRVWLEGEIFERDLPAARVGLEVRAEFPGLPGEVRRGRIAYVYPTVNADARTARIRVELANPGLALKPGMYGTIRFAAPSTPTLTVPRSAVLSTGERHLLFLTRGDGRFEPRLVTIGAQTDDRTEILDGVAAGDSVVASGTFLLDAESNLGTLLGGMGNMPGMDMAMPTRAGDAPAAAPMDHGRIDPGTMNHDTMPRDTVTPGAMNHDTMQHGTMDHGAMPMPGKE